MYGFEHTKSLFKNLRKLANSFLEIIDFINIKFGSQQNGNAGKDGHRQRMKIRLIDS